MAAKGELAAHLARAAMYWAVRAVRHTHGSLVEECERVLGGVFHPRLPACPPQPRLAVVNRLTATSVVDAEVCAGAYWTRYVACLVKEGVDTRLSADRVIQWDRQDDTK